MSAASNRRMETIKLPDARAADDLDRALGNAIRLRRRSLGMTQEQLANACGISFQQVQKYENGVNRISAGNLVLFARALGVSVASLFDGTSDTEPRSPRPEELSFSRVDYQLARELALISDDSVKRQLLALIRAMAS